MEAPPKTRYVEIQEAEIAYQVVGTGTRDLVYFYGLGSHIEHFWDNPVPAEFLKRLSAFSRLIFFDRRGNGASDGVDRNDIPTWEDWAEDLRAVLDVTESRQAAILASLDAGPTAILFAATHPHRVSALILVNTASRYLVADDYPLGASVEEVDALVDLLRTSWGTPELAQLTNPSIADDPEAVRAIARITRAAATPRTAAAQYSYILHSVDVRNVLPLIQVPTLVLHVRESPIAPIRHGRHIADHIEGARFVELPGADLGMTSTLYSVADEVAEFLTGERPPIAIERILTTVLFTDIVDSTKSAASLGDERWLSVLDVHDRVMREQLRWFHGKEIKTTGDGFVASFDGPARAIKCACALVEAAENVGIALRVGLHTGECDVRGGDLAGLAVHIAARVGALAAPGEVLVSGTLRDLVIGSGIEFAERGEYELKGVPGMWKLFAVLETGRTER